MNRPQIVLSRVLTEIARAILPNHTLFRSIFFEATQNPEIGAVFVRQVISNGFGILGGYLTRAMAAGRLRPLHPMIAVQGLIGPLSFICSRTRYSRRNSALRCR